MLRALEAEPRTAVPERGPRTQVVMATGGVEPADTAAEQPEPRTTHADERSLNLAAATRYREREGHLQVPREHIETVGVPPASCEGPEQRDVSLGTRISNQRSRAAALAAEKVEQLTALGMRCSQPPPASPAPRRSPRAQGRGRSCTPSSSGPTDDEAPTTGDLCSVGDASPIADNGPAA